VVLQYRVVPSAHAMQGTYFKQLGMPFVNTTNSNGLSMEPCGMPQVMVQTEPNSIVFEKRIRLIDGHICKHNRPIKFLTKHQILSVIRTL
jgi:hypothetical protein